VGFPLWLAVYQRFASPWNSAVSASRQQQPLNKNASVAECALLTDQSKLANHGHGKAKGI
jgi:hypothetical protein